ncbi:MAG: tol-pal system protein YbgF [Ghiorsea sp.]
MKLFFLGMKPSTLSMALSLVLVTGCATTKPESESWSEDKGLIVQSLQDAHVSNSVLDKKISNLDLRILDLERLSSEQQTKIVILESATKKNALPTRIMPVANKKKNTSLNKRLDALSVKLAPVAVKPVVVVPVVTEKEQADEKNAYTASYLALKSGRYDEASTGFVKVIRAHPKGEYTDQAYYWLGESLVALLRNTEALEAFTVVANQYSKSTKHEAALLKIAAVHKNMKQFDKAGAALLRVIKEYPDGRTAERARNELKALPKAAVEVVK